MTEAETPTIKRIAGLVLIVVGLLWTVLSGLCSAAFFVTLFTEGGGDVREALSIIPMILLVGGFSAGIGFVVYIVGRALRPKT
ncbi:MAG: hypothetical protein ABL996_26560 [Micropepsaceae bacterium]